MGLEEHIKNHELPALRQALLSAAAPEAEAALLFAASCAQAEAGCIVLEQCGNALASSVLGDALCLAAEHGGDFLVKALLEHYGQKLEDEALLAAVHHAIRARQEEVLEVLAQYPHIGDLINLEDSAHPHPIVTAVESGDEWVLEKLLSFPHLHVGYHHVVWAEQHGALKMAEILKLEMAFEHQHLIDEHGRIRADRILGASGPHLIKERYRREAKLRREREQSHD